MPHLQDDWYSFLCRYRPDFWHCGVLDGVLESKSQFLEFLREGYHRGNGTSLASFDGTTLSDDNLAKLADLVAQYVDAEYRDLILSRWRMPRLRPLLESTCWVRYLDAWHDGRQLLENDGIDLEESIFFYNGPGGTYATVEFVGEDGKAVGLDLDRDESNGSIRIGERWSCEDTEDREKDKAKAIWESGRLEWFNARVNEYLLEHYPEASS